MENKKNHEEKNEPKENDSTKAGLEKAVTLKEAEYLQLKTDAQKAKEAWDKLVRLQADFENARKRWDRDRNEFARFANEDLICDILTIVDELERSVELSQARYYGNKEVIKKA